MSLHPIQPAPLRTITAPSGEQVRGRLTDALHAKAWGKLEIGGASDAPVLSHDDLSDWLDFHVVNRVGAATQDRYRAGAERWAARMAAAFDQKDAA